MRFNLLTLTHNFCFFFCQSSSSFSANRDFEYATTIGGKWKRQDLQFCRFPSYDLTYAHYCKFPSWGLQEPFMSVATPHSFPSSSHSYCRASTVLTNLFFNRISSLSANTNQSQKHQNHHNHRNHQPNYIIPLMAALTCVQLLPFVLVYCIEECSPIVLFSWWRNKVSWEASQSITQCSRRHRMYPMVDQHTKQRYLHSSSFLPLSPYACTTINTIFPRNPTAHSPTVECVSEMFSWISLCFRAATRNYIGGDGATPRCWYILWFLFILVFAYAEYLLFN